MKKYIKSRIRKIVKESTKRLVKKVVGGVLIKSLDTDKVLLLERNDGLKRELWSFLTGGIEKGETVLSGLKREVNEEIGIDPEIIKYSFVELIKIPSKKMELHYYHGVVSEEFTPIINDEHHNWGWFSKSDLPSPLYPNTKEKIDNYE